MLGQAREHAVMLLDPEARVTWWSEGAERIFGYAPGEILGRPVSIIFTPEDRAAGLDRTELATAGSGTSAEDDRWQLRRDAVVEDHRHGVLDHGERERAEEHHGAEDHPPGHVAVVHEVLELVDERLRLPGHDPLEIALEGVEHFRGAHEVRQHDRDEDQQRHDRQQRVIRHRAREQQPLVRLERLQRLQHELPERARGHAELARHRLSSARARTVSTPRR
ncbi:MAG TPA: PAS domain S-box protein [Usitatibacter sp.]|nr:PAS domain S-box protein [Usitatibacter sp.]